jgi:predicted glycoside hydrolase/deacetylase ChbG (UPF0249 family)
MTNQPIWAASYFNMDPDSHPALHEHRRIVLCADDFGMNAAVDAGILALASLGRLSATSLLVDGPAAVPDVPALVRTPLQIGLHLNLTESFGQPDRCWPLRHLILAAYGRQLHRPMLQTAIRRQISRFQALVGRLPDYIDGHQHVHQLPGVREALLDVLREFPGYRPWVRHTGRPRVRGLPLRLRLKAWVIAGLGASSLRRQLQAQGYSCNPGFLGVYDFQGGVAAYQRWVPHWLSQCQAGDVFMCHPASGAEPADALSEQRQAEFSVLSGAPFGQWLADYRLIVAGAGELPVTASRETFA